MNSIKIAWRALNKRKLYSAINIAGLAVGIGAAILIYHIVSYELSFNKNWSGYERIVRICREDVSAEEGRSVSTGMPIPAMKMVATDFPQFKYAAKVKEVWPDLAVIDPNGGPHLRKLSIEDEDVAVFSEPSLFNIFNWTWLSGNAQDLDKPNTIVLNRTIAERCFDNWQNAQGRELMLDNLIRVQVIGVVEDAPINTDLPFSFMVSWPTLVANPDAYFYDESWGASSSNNQVYALLNEGVSFAAANTAIAQLGVKEYENVNERVKKKHFLEPLIDIHYNEELGSGSGYTISKKRIFILALIGVLIVIMAGFNFINLSTAMATERAKEIGIRKTLGSHRGQLVSYFLSETALIVFIALLAGVALAFLGSPWLKKISSLGGEASYLLTTRMWLFLLLLGVAITLLAGIYPALVLSSFEPIKILRTNFSGSGTRGISLRKLLVVLQFVIAQGLILGTIVIISQMAFIRHKDLGFKPDLIYTFAANYDSTSMTQLSSLKNELKALPVVEAVSFSSDLPSSGNTWSSNFGLGRGKDDAPFGISLKFCDADFQETYGIKLLAGRWFDDSRDSVREGVINQVVLQKLGITNQDSVIGQDVRLGGSTFIRVTGICENFHSHSIHEPLEPLLLSPRKRFYFYTGIKIRPDQVLNAERSIQSTFDKIFPNLVYDGEYFDEHIANFYAAEQRFAALCKGFAFLAILLSCLGLFGLASYSVSKRIKEIGVRKVLGASMESIVGLISKDFLWLVGLAFCIAIPLTWYMMNQWLDNFAYRISISWWMVAVTGVLIALIAFLAISYHSVRSALTNPVKSLRSE